MPIDVGLLRPECQGGKFEEVCCWQILRYGSDYDHNDELLQSVAALDTKRRQLVKTITDTRTRLHELQQSVLQSTNKEQIKTEMKRLKRNVIPDLEQSLKSISRELEAKLPSIANCVVSSDIQQPPVSDKENLSLTAFNKCDETVLDPLYCLRGYETLQGRTVLIGTGAALAGAISNHALLYCRNHFSTCSFSSTILPPCLQIDVSTATSILGCSKLSLNDCQIGESTEARTTTTAVPPWVAASLLHEGKKYFDRQLPMGRVIVTSGESSTIADQRERAPKVNSLSGVKQSWASKCQQGERIELFCLTGNTVSESSAMQLKLAHVMFDFYLSLLLDKHNHNLELRTVEPSRLLPCEASRMQVEDTTIGAVLGYVSNMTDYATRATNTRIADGYCHTVTGLLCRIPTTLEWMLQHNMVDYEKELGVGVPFPLSYPLQEQLGMIPPKEGVLFVPFSQRLHRNAKTGSLKRTELPNASKPIVIPTR